MTPDGHYVAFYWCGPRGTSATQLYVWNSQLAALVYTNATTSLSLVSYQFRRTTDLRLRSTSTQLFAADRSPTRAGQCQRGPTFLHMSGLQFSQDGDSGSPTRAPTRTFSSTIFRPATNAARQQKSQHPGSRKRCFRFSGHQRRRTVRGVSQRGQRSGQWR